MSDVDPGSPGYNQPPETSQQNDLPPDAVVPSGDTAGEQPAQSEQKDSGKFNAAEEARKIAEAKVAGVHPLESDTLQKAEQFEEKRKTELDEARAEHIRMREGGEVNK